MSVVVIEARHSAASWEEAGRHIPRARSEEVDSRSWWEYAECREADPELFFGNEYGSHERRKAAEHEAKLVCSHCPVRQQCLQAALRSDERHGIWGGLTLRERRKLKRQVALSAQ